jgi:hypothetical protein
MPSGAMRPRSGSTTQPSRNVSLNSLRQEGFEFTPEEFADFEKIVYGEMSLEEHRKKMFDMVERLKAEHPEIFYKGE